MKRHITAALLLTVLLLSSAVGALAKVGDYGPVQNDPAQAGYYVITNLTLHSLYEAVQYESGVDLREHMVSARLGDILQANGNMIEKRTEYGIVRYRGGRILRYEIGDPYEAERYVLDKNLTPVTEEQAMLIFNGVDWHDVLGVPREESSGAYAYGSSGGFSSQSSIFATDSPGQKQIWERCDRCGGDGYDDCGACDGGYIKVKRAGTDDFGRKVYETVRCPAYGCVYGNTLCTRCGGQGGKTVTVWE